MYPTFNAMNKIKRRKKQNLNKFFWQLLRDNPALLVGGVWLSMLTTGVVGWVKLTDPGKEAGIYPPPDSLTPTKIVTKKDASPFWGVAALFLGGVSTSLLLDKSQSKETITEFPLIKSKPLPQPSFNQVKLGKIPPFSPTIPPVKDDAHTFDFNKPVTMTDPTEKPPKTNILPPKLSFPLQRREKSPIKLINLP